jgi:hypothetical protein
MSAHALKNAAGLRVCVQLPSDPALVLVLPLPLPSLLVLPLLLLLLLPVLELPAPLSPKPPAVFQTVPAVPTAAAAAASFVLSSRSPRRWMARSRSSSEAARK